VIPKANRWDTKALTKRGKAPFWPEPKVHHVKGGYRRRGGPFALFWRDFETIETLSKQWGVAVRAPPGRARAGAVPRQRRQQNIHDRWLCGVHPLERGGCSFCSGTLLVLARFAAASSATALRAPAAHRSVAGSSSTPIWGSVSLDAAHTPQLWFSALC